MKLTILAILSITPLMAWQNDEIKYTEVSFFLKSGREITVQRISEDDLSLLPFPTGISYYIEEGLVLKVAGDKIYIDEAAIFSSDILLAINPWNFTKGTLMGGEVFVVDPFDFFDLMQEVKAIATPTRDKVDYFEVLTPEKQEKPSENRAINIWQCDETIHTDKPHNTHGDSKDPCHAQVGGRGTCQKGGTRGVASISCTTRVNPQGQEISECASKLECNNGRNGVLNGGPGVTSNVKCLSRTGTVDFTVGARPDGVLEMHCDSSVYTLDCR